MLLVFLNIKLLNISISKVGQIKKNNQLISGLDVAALQKKNNMQRLEQLTNLDINLTYYIRAAFPLMQQEVKVFQVWQFRN